MSWSSERLDWFYEPDMNLAGHGPSPPLRGFYAKKAGMHSATQAHKALLDSLAVQELKRP
jgi:hypothetical protein